MLKSNSSTIKLTEGVEEGQGDLGVYLRRLWRQRWTVLGITAAVLAAAGAYTLFAPPLYKVEMQMLLEDKNSQPKILSELAAGAATGSLLGSIDAAAQLETQIQVLQRRPIVESVVRELQPKYPELKDREYDEIAKLLEVERVGRTEVVAVSFKSYDPNLGREFLQRLADRYIDYGLDVQRAKFNNALAFIDADLPRVQKLVQQASLQLQTFREQYRLLDPQLQGTEMTKAMGTLEQDLEEARVAWQAAQRQYGHLSSRLGITPGRALASATLSTDKIYQNALKQLQEVETQLALERTRFSDEYPTVQNLKAKREKLRGQLALQTRAILGNNGEPALVSGGTSLRDSLALEALPQGSGAGVTARLGAVQLVLVEELLKAESLEKVQQARLSGLIEAKQRFMNRFADVPKLARQYQELSRLETIASTSFNRLLQRQQELRIQLSQEVSPWRIIEPPFIPEKPAWPKPSIVLGLGALLGLVLGSAVALVKDSQQRQKAWVGTNGYKANPQD